MTARWGALGARLRQVGIWSLAFIGTMSLPLVDGAAIALAGWLPRRNQPALSPAAKIVAVAALELPSGGYVLR